MRESYSLARSLVLLALLVLVGGCAVVGPKSISAGRRAYAEAINQTEDEQMLLSIVRSRYGETYSLLAVNGVAASLRFSAEVGAEIGVGSDNRAGDNLLLGGFAYEENPTITYTPVQGEQYIRELMSPIPLDVLLLSLRSDTFPERVLTLLVTRVNDLHNPDFQTWGGADSGGDFARFVELFADLRNAGLLDLSGDPQGGIAFNLLIEGYRPGHVDRVEEFLRLLGLTMPPGEVDPLVIPVSYAINTEHSWGLGLTTRSTYDLVEIMRAGVLVPEEHAADGLTVEYPAPGLAGRNVRVESAKERPANGSLAVNYRGYWFFIRENDQGTKAVFNTLRTLWSIAIAGAIDERDAPVLTLPLGR